jgi:hypothetical protein
VPWNYSNKPGGRKGGLIRENGSEMGLFLSADEKKGERIRVSYLFTGG